MNTVTFVDEALPGGRTEIGCVELTESTITAREIIIRRIAQDVAEYNANRRRMTTHGLVVPTQAVRELNATGVQQSGGGNAGSPVRRVTGLLDEDAMRRAALDGFESNGFFVFVGDRQLTSLDEEVEIGLNTEVVFIKLVPLVGG